MITMLTGFRAQVPTGLLVLLLVKGIEAAEPGETLYNGIVLPPPWPPQPTEWPHPNPVPPPYLVSPPAVIPIDVGRQLFVDDFLIEETTLQRTFHLAEYYADNPILRPDRPWESKDGLAEAMAFSDGVWFDPKDKLFKIWYVSGKENCTCLATSKDGIHWEKPALDVEPPTNIVLRRARDSATVWLDLDEKDPRQRFKLILFAMDAVERNKPLEFRHSPDSIHWSPVIASNGHPKFKSRLRLSSYDAFGEHTTTLEPPFPLWVDTFRPSIDNKRWYHRFSALTATGSSDPDDNALTCAWFVYAEAGTHRGEVSLNPANGWAARFVAPQTAKPETIHVLLRVQDDGQPPLCSYRRAVVTTSP